MVVDDSGDNPGHQDRPPRGTTTPWSKGRPDPRPESEEVDDHHQKHQQQQHQQRLSVTPTTTDQTTTTSESIPRPQVGSSSQAEEAPAGVMVLPPPPVPGPGPLFPPTHSRGGGRRRRSRECPFPRITKILFPATTWLRCRRPSSRSSPRWGHHPRRQMSATRNWFLDEERPYQFTVRPSSSSSSSPKDLEVTP